jgi:hypothetical protein
MGWVVNVTPRPLYPRKDTRYPLHRRLGGPQDRSGRVWKISPPPGFDPRTVHLVSSRRYTEYAVPAHKYIQYTGYVNIVYLTATALLQKLFSITDKFNRSFKKLRM